MKRPTLIEAVLAHNGAKIYFPASTLVFGPNVGEPGMWAVSGGEEYHLSSTVEEVLKQFPETMEE